MRTIKKIVFGITSLTIGGAERVLVDIANKLCNKYDITIFTLYANGELEKELNRKIKLESLYNAEYKNLSKLQKIKISLRILFFKKSIYTKYINGKYETEIAFLEGPITRIFSIKNRAMQKIAWIHNDITKVFGKGFKATLKKKMDKTIYEKYNKLVFVSEDNLKKFENVYKLDAEKLVIENYLDEDRIFKLVSINFDKTEFTGDQLNFVMVSRLVSQKGIDRLIKVHYDLIRNGINHKIYIIGDGPERKKLGDLIQQYKVKKTFILLGQKENPYPYIKATDVFALLSYFEGYPMVLKEAKILKKPIIITDTAAREVLTEYEPKLIVDNTEEGIYKGIEKIVNNKDTFIQQGKDNNDNNDIIKNIIELVGE